MSQPKRYGIVCDFKAPWSKMHEFEKGEWVQYSDYAALQAENERLRKAGDAVALDYAERIEIEAGEPAETLMRNLPVLKAWASANEGR